MQAGEAATSAAAVVASVTRVGDAVGGAAGGGVALNRQRELAQIAVAEHANELAFGLEYADGRPAQAACRRTAGA